MKKSLSIGLWLLTGNGAFAGEAITEKNWVNHPEIVEVRSLYQAIKESKDAGNLTRKERKFHYCAPYRRHSPYPLHGSEWKTTNLLLPGRFR